MENASTKRDMTAGRPLLDLLLAPLILAAVIFAACLLGIYTRPIGFLATIWPANAIMLGLLIRMPRSASILGWTFAIAAYMAADLLTGSAPLKALLLNGANVVGVAAAYMTYARLSADLKRLRHPAAMLGLLLVSAAGGAAAGIPGGFVNPILFGGDIFDGWVFWFVTEFVNYIAILPVILTAPSLLSPAAIQAPLHSLREIDAMPVAALFLSCLGAVIIGGPGAIAFPVPALLWCGLAYPLFPSAVLTLLFSFWSLLAISAGYLPSLPGASDEAALISVRMGVSLISIAPIMLASVMASRNDLLARLHNLATYDQLTGAINRSAFREIAERRLAGRKQPTALLMIDLDNFKAVNDQFGHAGGDQVLSVFAQRVQECLRAQDVFARLGGEEFAVLLSSCASGDALPIAERIRNAIAAQPIMLADGRKVPATASLGVAICNGGPSLLDCLLADADDALYAAKDGGRNRVEASPHNGIEVPVGAIGAA